MRHFDSVGMLEDFLDIKCHYKDFDSTSGHSSVGRALASQAEGRGFESRCPLHFFLHKLA